VHAADLLEVVHGRHNELIDPSLHVWGWEIPVYLFLGGLAAGLLILPAALAWRRPGSELPDVVRWAPFLSLALISLGMVALFLDLEMKGHVYRFYLAFRPTSPMSWGSWILVLVYPVGWLLGAGLLCGGRGSDFVGGRLGELLEKSAIPFQTQRRAVLSVSVMAGIALGAYTGLLLGSLGARPLWNSTLLGPLFLVSGVSTAAALLALFPLSHRVHQKLSRWELSVIGTEAALLGLYLLDLATGSRASVGAAQMFLGGSWTGAFWALVVTLGLVVPFALKWTELNRHGRPTLAAPVLVLIGGFCLRWIVVAAGQAHSYASLLP
jgi:formate-dependent nitrite reductase membrane component NrfD